MNIKALSIYLPIIIAAISSSYFAPVSAASNALVIENAWIAEAPPVSKVMVAYMTISNSSDEDLEIIHASSETYSSIEFHETVHEDDMARMIRHDSLQIDAHSSIELKRGGPHLMLFNPVRRLRAGDEVEIELTLYNRQTISISVPVKKTQ